jgi:hypothetical protein
MLKASGGDSGREGNKEKGEKRKYVLTTLEERGGTVRHMQSRSVNCCFSVPYCVSNSIYRERRRQGEQEGRRR